MRSANIPKFILICAACLAAAVFLNYKILGVVRRQYFPAADATSLFDLSGQLREWAANLAKWRSLASQNDSLRSSSNALLAAQAQIQALQSENSDLKKSLGLGSKLNRQLIPAGVYSVSLDTGSYRALINKGSVDGISSGETVVSPDGVLVGKVGAVFGSSAQVILTEDPSFSVTVKVLNGQTTGILKGALDQGLALELVTQTDQISEGDTLVTTGNDQMPAGLVVGSVRLVQNNETQLFKEVKVIPALAPGFQGSVDVIKQ